MDPAIVVLLAIVVCFIPVATKTVSQVQKKISGITERMIKVETKLDIYLDHAGLDVRKVNKAIADNIEEIKKNDKPTVGCINVKELYKEV